MRKYFLLLIHTFIVFIACAQSDTTWHHKKCAVVLTYDDALSVHLDNAIPLLDSLKLKATFYLSGYSGVLDKRLSEWRAAARAGHELGNHTLFHPCTGKIPGRDFVTADYDLNNYSIRRMIDEIRMTNTLLKSIDGKTKRTFAYPCGDTKIHDSLYLNGLKNEFIAARGVKTEMPGIEQVDMYNIGCYTVTGQTGDELISIVKKALSQKALLVFLFHGVGGGHFLNVSLAAHRKLLYFLKQNENEIWIAPMIEVADFIKEYRHNK